MSSSWSSGAGGGSSRWKRIRGALFHGHSGRSFSPGSHHHHVIEEGMENPSPGEEVISGSSVVTYRASLQRLPSNENQRWTVHGGIGDHQKPAVYDPIPSCPIQLSANLHPPKLDLPWNSSVDGNNNFRKCFPSMTNIDLKISHPLPRAGLACLHHFTRCGCVCGFPSMEPVLLALDPRAGRSWRWRTARLLSPLFTNQRYTQS